MKTQKAKHPPQRPWDLAKILERVGEKVADGKDRLRPAKEAAAGAPRIIDELVGLMDEQGYLFDEARSPFVLERFADAAEDHRFSLAQVATVREARDELARQWSARLTGRQSERLEPGTLRALMVDALCVVGPQSGGCDQLLSEFFPGGQAFFSTPEQPRIVGIPLLRLEIEKAKDTDGKPFDLRGYFERCLNKAGL
jgi:hypothetical protein